VAIATQQAGAVESALKTGDQRKELLAQNVAAQIRSGRRVESQSDYQAVIVYGHKVNHILHFLLGFVTFGLWWLVWIMLAIGGGERRELIVVDEFGNASVQKLPR
jgi:hypothetical protein